MSTVGIAHKLDDTERTQDVRLKELAPFSKMVLSDALRKGLQQAGFVYPTVIQATAIPVGKSGLDLMVQSKSGTGKTLIFCSILLEAYRSDVAEPQALVVAPTREIAVQIEDVLNQIGRSCRGFRAVCVIGGLDVADDRKRLQGAKAVVGTPGRILHLIKNDVLNTSEISLLVLDEADKLYTQTFRQDVQRIHSALPVKRQTVACSATFCNNLDRELAKIMQNPLLVSTENRASLLVGIKQFAYELPEQKTSILEMQLKLDALRYIFGKVAFKQCLIFAGSQSRADSYCSYLEKDGWPCELISGAQDQRTRLENFRKFREFKTRILLATDLMARGVDSEYVNLVINMELPSDVVTYLHRIGRAGRFGSHGLAISFVASEKDRCTFRRVITEVGSGMNVLLFPPKTRAQMDERDFWDFSDDAEDCKYFGVFGSGPLLAPLASHEMASVSGSQSDDKENYGNNCLSVTHSSIDTKTFEVDSNESAYNANDLHVDRPEEQLPDIGALTSNTQPSSAQQLPGRAPLRSNSQHSSTQQLPSEAPLISDSCQSSSQLFSGPAPLSSDSRHSSSQQLPSSNTIDDASSLTADSLRSSQQDVSRYQSVLMQKAAIPTLVEFLVDPASLSDGPKGTNGGTGDLFDDYTNAVLNDEDSSTTETEVTADGPLWSANKLANLKNLLIDRPVEETKSHKCGDLYADHANFNADEKSSTEEVDKGTFILSVATPSNACDSLEELQSCSELNAGTSSASTATQGLADVKHFTSPVHSQPATSIPDVVPPNPKLASVPGLTQKQKQQRLTVNVGTQIEIAPSLRPPREELALPLANNADTLSTSTDSNRTNRTADDDVEHSGSETERAGGSSGFDEKASESGSSGIEGSGDEHVQKLDSYPTSSVKSENSESYNEEDGYEGEEEEENEDYEEQDEDEDEDVANEDEEEIDEVESYFESDDEVEEEPQGGVKNVKSSKGQSSSTMPPESDAQQSHSLAYQNAYTRWMDMYWSQVAHIQNYVRFCKKTQQHHNSKAQ